MTQITVTLLIGPDRFVFDSPPEHALAYAVLLVRHFAAAGRALYEITIEHDDERWTWRTTQAQILHALALGAR